MDIENAVKTLAQAFWGRPPVSAELVAMVGEVERDSFAIAAAAEGQNGGLFNIEPAHFDHLLQKEAER